MKPASNVRPGLRERKKLKTRKSVQEEALRLFSEQGYAATTVEQIAEAAEVSPSTFFRYFPSKEDVVLHDAYDEPLIEAFRSQPPEQSPFEALRSSFRMVFGDLPEDEQERERACQRLIMSTPELRGRALDQLYGSLEMLAGLVAERAGRPADDIGVLAFTGAVIGVAMAVVGPTIASRDADYMALFDEALAQLGPALSL
ncbi:MAG: acyl-CoA-like ligand-binding transcription factor [Gaiellaceae bacterium]